MQDFLEELQQDLSQVLSLAERELADLVKYLVVVVEVVELQVNLAEGLNVNQVKLAVNAPALFAGFLSLVESLFDIVHLLNESLEQHQQPELKGNQFSLLFLLHFPHLLFKRFFVEAVLRSDVHEDLSKGEH